MKKLFSCVLVFMLMSLFVGGPFKELCEVNASETEMISESIETASAEITKARDLGILPEAWSNNLSQEADFHGFSELTAGFFTLYSEESLASWKSYVDEDAYPSRSMMRDDCLVLLMLAGDAIGYTSYNARDYRFCTENEVDYDAMAAQLSWDYPYCRDIDREIILRHSPEETDDPIGNVPITALFWMQRRMDINQRAHFLDCDDSLDFHLDQPLTREAAVTAVIRLYNSEMLEYDDSDIIREVNEADTTLLAEADEVVGTILNHAESLSCDGTAYYVSNSGNDENDGLTPETAWATLRKVNTTELQYGDGVYFERGGLWRGQLWAQEGVTYSAYGDGDKPKIYGSPENGADSEKWSLLEGTDNIWVYYTDMMDCGSLVFNNDENYAIKVAPKYVNGYLSAANEGEFFDVKTELTDDLMFFSEVDSVLYDGVPLSFNVMDWCDRGEYPDAVGALYLRCDRGNPGEVFESIEFMVRDNLIVVAEDTVFNNLCLKYTGFHGIWGSSAFDVSFCEIGWIGGSPQGYDDDGNPVRGGNGVECGGDVDHYSVTDCYIYQCWDTGISHQFGGVPVVMSNITYARNVVIYADAAVEVFFDTEDCLMENVLISDNYFLYSGYGWFHDPRLKESWGAAYQGYSYPNRSINFRMENNVFYLSTGPLVSTVTKEEWIPVMNGNTYVQTVGGILAIWPDEAGEAVTYYYDDSESARAIIEGIIQDNHCTVLPD